MFAASVRRVLILLAALIAVSEGYTILGILPTAAKSHFIIGHSFMKGLANAGHDVYVISPFPLKKPIPNYHDVDISSILNEPAGVLMNALEMKNQGLFEVFQLIYELGRNCTEYSLTHPNVIKLLEKKEIKFDAIVVEAFATDVFFGLGEQLNAPVIGYSPFGASKWTCDLTGTPSPLSYVPHAFLSFTDSMSFFERMANTITTVVENFAMSMWFYPQHEELYKKLFPNNKLSFAEARKNVALVLLNQHYSISTPRPYVPNMIEVGGLQIDPVKPLPEDIKSFLDNSPEGVVYFSMGSIIQGVNLPVEKRNAFIKVFASLKQKVLWKYENDTLPNKPDNVMIAQWMPQNDILAHPNVKLFITHGGLLGSTEALYHGKAVVGIPIYGDQYLNIVRAERAGYGVLLDYNTITEDSIRNALKRVLDNPEYAAKVSLGSELYRDRIKTPLETAVYWIEYIARHKGAPHLRATAVDLNFIQYHMLDVYLSLIVVIASIILLIKFVLKKLLSLVFGGGKQKKKSSKSNNKKKAQ